VPVDVVVADAVVLVLVGHCCQYQHYCLSQNACGRYNIIPCLDYLDLVVKECLVDCHIGHFVR
jgi:hypothetical protein